MKRPITNQTSLQETGMRQNSTHPGAAVVGAIAILLFGMTAANSGQGGALSTRARPIEDFLNAQGTLPFPAELQSLGWTDPKTVRFAQVDFTGSANKWIEEESANFDDPISLGTEIEGKVLERPLPDGRAEVTVLLHTRNALTWVVELESLAQPIDPYSDYLVFGHRAQDVLQGDDPALGESFLKWVFINDAPGDELPDLLAEMVAGPTVEMIMLSFEAHAVGTLREPFGVPDGTPGHAQVTEIGLGKGATPDGWPAEHINLKVAGR
ncbi:MAG: hypothetical protein AB9869_24820 [Verrucomicrobiia bacterium]